MPGNDGAIKHTMLCLRHGNRFYRRSKKCDIPVLVMHGEDDQIVPFELTALKGSKLLKWKIDFVSWFSARHANYLPPYHEDLLIY
jgi:pimeloyl-ACP methyl ester carboxylesterase